MTDQEQTVVVGLGELQVTRDSSVILTCLGLGSCVSLCAYDPVSKVAGMVHIVLPLSNGRSGEPSPKYADAAIPMLLEEMNKHGALMRRLIVKMVGGAQMSTAPGIGSIFETGERNVKATKEILTESGITVKAADTGGTHGRTVRLFVDSGRVTVGTVGHSAREI